MKKLIDIALKIAEKVNGSILLDELNSHFVCIRTETSKIYLLVTDNGILVKTDDGITTIEEYCE